MQTPRAMEILDALRRHESWSATSEEVAFLAGRGLIESVDRDARDDLETAVQELPGLTDHVRLLARSVHGTAGLGPEGVLRGAGASREELRAATTRLEELTRQRAVLDSLVWNDSTESFGRLTLEGKRTLADLSNWAARLGDVSFEEFQLRMANYRTSLAATVDRARRLLDVLTDIQAFGGDAPFTRPDLRLASLVLAKNAGDAVQVAQTFMYAYRTTQWYNTRPEDQLVTTIVLACLPNVGGVAQRAFTDLREQLRSQGVPPDQEPLVAASLADVLDTDRAAVVARFADLRSRRPDLNPALLTGLARAPYTIDDTLSRFQYAGDSLNRLGYADGEQMHAASMVLASAALPLESLVDRFPKIATRLSTGFSSPIVPAALLATSYLEPNETVEALEESIGAVTRGNYFDLTVEIESLALALSYVSEPLDLRSAVAGVPPPEVLAPPVVAAAAVSTWIIPHNYWVYRPVVWYIATHPAHIHTVAAFG